MFSGWQGGAMAQQRDGSRMGTSDIELCTCCIVDGPGAAETETSSINRAIDL